MDMRPTPPASSALAVDRIIGLQNAQGLALRDLSDFFNPFLPRFVEEALRGGGEVWMVRDGSDLRGLLLYNVVEKVGSIFSRDVAAAERLFAIEEKGAFFSDFQLSTKTETYHIYATDPSEGNAAHRFTHPVRMARMSEHPTIVRVLNEMYGRIDTSWLQAVSPKEERCFVVDVADEIAGVGWVSVVGAHGRLHSLSVRPHYRRLGIGTDLWHARVMWARQAGARRVISEISEHNVASRAVAAAGGMRPIGRQFLSFKPGPPATPGSALGSATERAHLVGHVD
jgi:GNAT superfamily N-acetyltransferase